MRTLCRPKPSAGEYLRGVQIDDLEAVGEPSLAQVFLLEVSPHFIYSRLYPNTVPRTLSKIREESHPKVRKVGMKTYCDRLCVHICIEFYAKLRFFREVKTYLGNQGKVSHSKSTHLADTTTVNSLKLVNLHWQKADLVFSFKLL